MKICFHASEKAQAQAALEEYIKKYGQTPIEEADVLAVLGGDGTMLHALHAFITAEIPIYGVNLGTLGFLLKAILTPPTSNSPCVAARVWRSPARN